MPQELVAEFKREFGLCEPEVIEKAFRAWRRQSPHNPSIFEIRQLIEQAAIEKRREQEEKQAEQERNEIEQARQDGRTMGFEELRDILGHYVEQKPKPAYTPPSPEELKRRKDEQLKALEEKYGRKPAV